MLSWDRLLPFYAANIIESFWLQHSKTLSGPFDYTVVLTSTREDPNTLPLRLCRCVVTNQVQPLQLYPCLGHRLFSKRRIFKYPSYSIVTPLHIFPSRSFFTQWASCFSLTQRAIFQILLRSLSRKPGRHKFRYPVMKFSRRLWIASHWLHRR